MTLKEYLEHKAYSRSHLLLMERCPKYFYYHTHTNPDDTEPTKALSIGSALHYLVLEPELFADNVAVLPSDLKKPSITQINAKKPSEETLLQIQDWNAFVRESAGKIVISESELESVSLMAEAITSDEDVLQYIRATGKSEHTLLYECDGIPLKVRIDRICEDDGFCIDIKTCADASPSAFARSVINYGYDMQAHMIMQACRFHGLPVKTFYFICVEKEVPHCVAVYRCGRDVLESGAMRFEKALSTLKHCLATDTWPSYTMEAQELLLPNWHMNELVDANADVVL